MSAKPEQPDFKLLKVSDITVWESANVRHSEVGEGLDELAASIKEIGLLQPILVQEIDSARALASDSRDANLPQLLQTAHGAEGKDTRRGRWHQD